jgi:hypothetical protein
MASIEFKGDIAVASEACVGTKGGSLAATFKQAIRDRLGALPEGQLTAAVLTFAAGHSVVRLGGGSETAQCLRVSRVGRNRFEIELDDGEDDTVDDLTAAFLTLKAQQLKDGSARLRGPVDADTWLAEIDDVTRRAKASSDD